MPLPLSRWVCAAVAAVVPAAAVAQNRPAVPNVAATVNGEVIRLDQVDAAVRRLAVAGGPLSASQAARLRREVVQDLIDDVLVRQYLRQHGPTVEPAEVEKHFRALAAGLQKQGKSLADFYRESGQTEAQVRETWADLLRFQKYVEQQATDERLRKYHEANREVFDKTTVRVSHIVVRVGPDAPPGEWAAARQKLATVRADILAGKMTFADAARKYSLCPTAPAGGEIGEVGRRDAVVDEAFTRAAFALKVGGVSEPTDTEFGVHLIRVSDRKAGTPEPFERVADLVRECYAEDVRRGLVAQLRKQAAIQVTVP